MTDRLFPVDSDPAVPEGEAWLVQDGRILARVALPPTPPPTVDPLTADDLRRASEIVELAADAMEHDAAAYPTIRAAQADKYDLATRLSAAAAVLAGRAGGDGRWTLSSGRR